MNKSYLFTTQNVKLQHGILTTIYFYFDITKEDRWLDAQKCAANLVQLLETDVLGVLPEALMAHVQAVLSDQTMSVGAGTTSAGALSIFARPGVVDIFETHVDAEPKI